MSEANIRLEDADLGSASTSWYATVPRGAEPPAVPAPPSDPAGLATMTALVQWPAVHAALAEARVGKADQLMSAVGATAQIIDTRDTENAQVVRGAAEEPA
jgi:hypothetical protein